MCLAHANVTIVVIGGVVFGVWLLVAILRLLGRMVSGVLRVLFGAPMAWCNGGRAGPGSTERICARPRCGHANPAGARFCARCGSRLGSVEDVDDYG